jgi:ribonuclease R
VRRPLPTREQILEFIRSSPERLGKRELAKAFQVVPEDRASFREILKGLESKGEVERGHGRRFGAAGSLPDVAILVVSGTDTDGELLARPEVWRGEGPPPRIYMAPAAKSDIPLGVGDKVLAKLRRLRDGVYEGRTIRKLTAGPGRVLGLYALTPDGLGRLRPTDRRQKSEYVVGPHDTNGAVPGELVQAEILSGSRPHGLRSVRIVERLGSMEDPRSISLVAIATHDIPDVFPPEAIQQAEAAKAAPLDKRDDLRSTPLITIDGEDARDFDDAVWAEPAEDGGWHLIVAIADVA